MKCKSNVCLSKLTNFLQEKYSNYIFKSDTYLNLIEIITLENAKKGSDESENVLMVNDSNVSLMYTTDNKKILEIEEQANDFMKVSEE